MDCDKTGKLILKLRKERGLTQQNVADTLGISNKTVSKWECGLGCPDVSLWPELSTLLGVDMEKILSGELQPNAPDVGNIQRIRFYVCPHCRNILFCTGAATLSCCGRKLSPLVPVDAEPGLSSKVEELDVEYYFSTNHAMRKDHHLLFVAYVLTDRVHLHRLYPEQSATARLPLMGRGGTVYLYCTQHGLQRFPLR